MDYKELETEYLDFIKKKKYGTPTMIVALSKEGKSVYPRETLNFLDHQHLTRETVIDIESISR